MDGKHIPPKIGRNMLVIGHGIDNREVWIDLNEVIGITISSRIIDSTDGTWSHYTTFYFRGGEKIEDELSDKGMEVLAEKMNVEGWTVDPESE